MPAVLAGAGTSSHHRARRHRGRRDAAGRPVRPADQARAQQRRRPVRLRPARVRRLRRLSRRLVLLDPGLGRQRRHRRRRGCSTSTPCSASTTRPAWTNWGIALIGLWVPAAVNLAGVRQMAWFQNVTVVLKFLPLLFVGVVGWFFVTKRQLRRRSTPRAAASTAASASPPGWRCSPSSASRPRRSRPSGSKNPRLNVGRASMLGTAASAILYVLVTAAVMGLVRTTPWSTTARRSSTPSKRSSPTALGREVHRRDGRHLRHRRAERLDADRDRDVPGDAQDGLFPRPFAWTDRNGHGLVRHRGRRRCCRRC